MPDPGEQLEKNLADLVASLIAGRIANPVDADYIASIRRLGQRFQEMTEAIANLDLGLISTADDPRKIEE